MTALTAGIVVTAAARTQAASQAQARRDGWLARLLASLADTTTGGK